MAVASINTDKNFIILFFIGMFQLARQLFCTETTDKIMRKLVFIGNIPCCSFSRAVKMPTKN